MDSGTVGSFINQGFVIANQLPLTKLCVPFSCRSFDGSLATSGDIMHCWHGSMTGSNLFHWSRTFRISLFVVTLSTSNIILGLPNWLFQNHAWVGGPLGQLSFSTPFSTLSPSSTHMSSLSTNTLLSDKILSLGSA
jgi:hypothetical protein